jgi:5-hydroxyisourate hydrolase-like protein (transthyretin family)
MTYIGFALIVIAGASLLPATDGAVKVFVTDASGKPVRQALVRADRMDEGTTVGVVPECLTDESGKCSCEHLSFGAYTVNASKVEAGYPPMHIPLFRHGQPPKTFRLSTDHPTEEISLALGPKAASIEVSVIDDATGKPVENPRVILYRASNRNDFLGTSPDLSARVLIPTDDDILIEVRAHGYKPWHLIEHAEVNGGRPLHLQSGEEKPITVHLHHD